MKFRLKFLSLIFKHLLAKPMARALVSSSAARTRKAPMRRGAAFAPALPIAAAIVFTLLAALPLVAQTYRGGIGGTVLDSSGAAIPNARVVLTSTDTGAVRQTVTTTSGDYVFQDLQIGTYSLSISAAGFGTETLKDIRVNPGAVTPINTTLSVSGAQEVVDVSADTNSEIQTESSANNAIISEKAVSEIPLNGRSFLQLLALAPGYVDGSLNGSRTNQLNYQIDGADNNDIWQGAEAANQGGVGPIAGVILPIDAIDQFSIQSSGNAEEGHSAGGLVSATLKTGTNQFHGTAYMYLRSEFFANKDFFALESARKQKVRNQQFGGSLGGPIIKDRLLFFGNYERQVYNIQLSSNEDTEPGAAYVTEATQLLARHGIESVNPLSLKLLETLWPGGNAPDLVANLSNYVETHERHGYSDNFVGNLNYIVSPKQTLRLQSFIGTGRQAEPGGPTYWYFQVAPDITQNFSLADNWAPTQHLSNELLIATGIFNQTFNDLNHTFDMPALGLDTGVTNPSLFGAPTISLSGFDGTGATQPLGRKDYTGHITDSATWIHGKHQIRFGGEFRRSYIDLQYQANTRGTFSFTGYVSQNLTGSLALTAGQSAWSESASTAKVCGTTTPLPAACGGVDDYSIIGSHTEVLALADFLAGDFNSASFVTGNLRRDLYRTDTAFFIQDQYHIIPKLVLNFGLRHDFFGDLSTTGPLSEWRPGDAAADENGLILVGTPGKPETYVPGKLHFSPRVGFNYSASNKLSVHGSYGIYFDAPPFNGFGNNGSIASGSTATGLQANPVGGVGNVSLGVSQWQTNQYVWSSATGPSLYGLFSVDPDLHTAYSNEYNLGAEYQLNNRTVLTLGYAGSMGVHLYLLRDANQPAPWSASAPQNPNTPSINCDATNNIANVNCTLVRRPSYINKSVTNYAGVGPVEEVSSEAASSYNSLQAVIRTSGYHGLTGQLAWTYGHALDDGSGFRSTGPTDSDNLGLDWGSSTFDMRNNLSGYVVWQVPGSHALPLLTRGWQVTGFVTAHTSAPFSITEGDYTGIGMNKDRVDWSGKKYTTGSRTIVHDSTGRKYIQYWVSSPAGIFSTPAYGSHGNTGRDQFRGPGYFDIDSSLVKSTRLHEGLSLVLRAEMFNTFNHLNPDNPSTSITSSTFGEITSAPTGITAGAPFNVQFAGRLVF